jgi:hypothetical protein
MKMAKAGVMAGINGIINGNGVENDYQWHRKAK